MPAEVGVSGDWNFKRLAAAEPFIPGWELPTIANRKSLFAAGFPAGLYYA